VPVVSVNSRVVPAASRLHVLERARIEDTVSGHASERRLIRQMKTTHYQSSTASGSSSSSICVNRPIVIETQIRYRRPLLYVYITGLRAIYAIYVTANCNT